LIAWSLLSLVVLTVGCAIVVYNSSRYPLGRLRFETKALMAAAWVLIFLVLAFMLHRFGGAE